jgi:hypothetical protein
MWRCRGMVWFEIIIVTGGLGDIRPKCTWRRRLSGRSPAYDKQLRVNLTITDSVSTVIVVRSLVPNSLLAMRTKCSSNSNRNNIGTSSEYPMKAGKEFEFLFNFLYVKEGLEINYMYINKDSYAKC